MPAHARVVWDLPKIALISQGLPRAAHQIGLLAAAEASAALLRSRTKHSSTGRLAADVARPNEISELSGSVGSDLVYAAIQNEGGTIRPVHSDRLLIHGQLGEEGFIPGAREPSGRFAQASDVVASASEVTLEGKHYLDAAVPAYEAAVTAAMREGFPR